MKTYVIQIHNDGGANSDNIFIFGNFENAKDEFYRQLELQKRISNGVEISIEPSDDGCDADGKFTVENADGTNTTVKLYDYHVLGEDD